MATPNYSYEKRQRELAKKRKAEEKRQKKLSNKGTDNAGDSQPPEPSDAPSDASPPPAG